MLQIIIFVSFWTILSQMLQMDSFDIILRHFGSKAAQMLQMFSFATILDHFGPKATQMLGGPSHRKGVV